jgi:hypothetical protein
MLGQVSKTFAVQKYAINRKTIGDFETFACFRDFLFKENFDF